MTVLLPIYTYSNINISGTLQNDSQMLNSGLGMPMRMMTCENKMAARFHLYVHILENK